MYRLNNPSINFDDTATRVLPRRSSPNSGAVGRFHRCFLVPHDVISIRNAYTSIAPAARSRKSLTARDTIDGSRRARGRSLPFLKWPARTGGFVSARRGTWKRGESSRPRGIALLRPPSINNTRKTTRRCDEFIRPAGDFRLFSTYSVTRSFGHVRGDCNRDYNRQPRLQV